MAKSKRPPLYFWQLPMKHWMPHHPTQAVLFSIMLLLVTLFFKVATKSEIDEQLSSRSADIENIKASVDSIGIMLDVVVLELDTLQKSTDVSIGIQKSVRVRVSNIKTGVNDIKTQTSETLNFLDKK